MLNSHSSVIHFDCHCCWIFLTKNRFADSLSQFFWSSTTCLLRFSSFSTYNLSSISFSVCWIVNKASLHYSKNTGLDSIQRWLLVLLNSHSAFIFIFWSAFLLNSGEKKNSTIKFCYTYFTELKVSAKRLANLFS